ncbi:alpha/beta hydrolase [Niabella beijingensis]|uniref:alpha/beta hydrolase n=1 Tax=Niabella beijingensis TaxID=2872700 RepID=UPI001CBC3F07|nr:alpha/beta hydrolase-fold protein [Niabella beijingensis]MBZ4191131.1 hypothetical protein [Niabella beijingensis]
MKILSALLLVLMTGSSPAQATVNSATDSIVIAYRKDTLHSSLLNEDRTIKVYLPPNFKKNEKYPVLYVLDESWMFEPTVQEVRKLTSFNIIPPSIVVGISSPDRGKDVSLNFKIGAFSETSKKFSAYIVTELREFITQHYAASGFNILVGHSDGASFAQKVLTTYPAAFRGVICLSQNLFGDQLGEFRDFMNQQFTSNIYYYVASGTRDATSRIRSGQALDSLFRLNHNAHLKTKQELFEAEHFGVGGIGLSGGITFVFSDYYQPNDWNRPLIDSLKKTGADPEKIIELYTSAVADIYNVDVKPSRSGVLSLAFAIITNKEQAANYLNYMSKLPPENDQFNSSAAQLYERIHEYNIALEYWVKYLTDPHTYKGHFFYFRRPIELLAYKMNDGTRAIDFAKKWEKQAPVLQLSFSYFIAKIAADKNIRKKEGLNAIEYFINNYDPSRTQYSLEEGKKLLEQLKQ